MPDELLTFEDEADDEPPRSKLGAVLTMLRPPNLPTAWADVLLGYWMMQWAEPWGKPVQLAALLGSSSCLYLAGMVWNDVFDVEADRVERPDRPIPSGDVSIGFARMLAVVLTVLGLAFAAVAGTASLAVAGALVVAILFYDAFAKNYFFGPPAMGLCRALNILLGVSPQLPFLMRGVAPDLPPAMAAMALAWSTFWWTFPLGNGVYITGVTLFSRQEASVSSRSKLTAAALVMAAGFGVNAWSLSRVPQLESAVWIVLGFAALTVGFRVLRAILNPAPRTVQTAVGSSITALIMIDAALLLAVQTQNHAMIVVCLLPVSVFAARWYYST
jgi:hypothetical protein